VELEDFDASRFRQVLRGLKQISFVSGVLLSRQKIIFVIEDGLILNKNHIYIYRVDTPNK
jgi:hypothetical protein